MPAAAEHPRGTREVSVLGGTCWEGVGDLPVIQRSFLSAQVTFDLTHRQPNSRAAWAELQAVQEKEIEKFRTSYK